jgi:non-ribosomal peptide synthetase component E (peptide arylation enzyme)
MTEYDVILPKQRIAEMSIAGYWSERTITDYLDDAIAAVPDKLAISAHRVAGGEHATLTYAELGRTVDRVALGLVGLGISPGDTVFTAKAFKDNADLFFG